MPKLNLLSNRGPSKPGEDGINYLEIDDPSRACSDNNTPPNSDQYNYNKTWSMHMEYSLISVISMFGHQF